MTEIYTAYHVNVSICFEKHQDRTTKERPVSKQDHNSNNANISKQMTVYFKKGPYSAGHYPFQQLEFMWLDPTIRNKYVE